MHDGDLDPAKRALEIKGLKENLRQVALLRVKTKLEIRDLAFAPLRTWLTVLQLVVTAILTWFVATSGWAFQNGLDQRSHAEKSAEHRDELYGKALQDFGNSNPLIRAGAAISLSKLASGPDGDCALPKASAEVTSRCQQTITLLLNRLADETDDAALSVILGEASEFGKPALATAVNVNQQAGLRFAAAAGNLIGMEMQGFDIAEPDADGLPEIELISRHTDVPKISGRLGDEPSLDRNASPPNIPGWAGSLEIFRYAPRGRPTAVTRPALASACSGDREQNARFPGPEISRTQFPVRDSLYLGFSCAALRNLTASLQRSSPALGGDYPVPAFEAFDAGEILAIANLHKAFVAERTSAYRGPFLGRDIKALTAALNEAKKRARSLVISSILLSRLLASSANDLDGAALNDVVLLGADLRGGIRGIHDCSNSYISGDARGAELSFCDFHGAYLSSLRLDGARLRFTELCGTRFPIFNDNDELNLKTTPDFTGADWWSSRIVVDGIPLKALVPYNRPAFDRAQWLATGHYVVPMLRWFQYVFPVEAQASLRRIGPIADRTRWFGCDGAPERGDWMIVRN